MAIRLEDEREDQVYLSCIPSRSPLQRRPGRCSANQIVAEALRTHAGCEGPQSWSRRIHEGQWRILLDLKQGVRNMHKFGAFHLQMKHQNVNKGAIKALHTADVLRKCLCNVEGTFGRRIPCDNIGF